MVEIMARTPPGVIGTTKENLKAAADGELMSGNALPDVCRDGKRRGVCPDRKPLP